MEQIEKPGDRAGWVIDPVALWGLVGAPGRADPAPADREAESGQAAVDPSDLAGATAGHRGATAALDRVLPEPGIGLPEIEAGLDTTPSPGVRLSAGLAIPTGTGAADEEARLAPKPDDKGAPTVSVTVDEPAPPAPPDTTARAVQPATGLIAPIEDVVLVTTYENWIDIVNTDYAEVPTAYPMLSGSTAFKITSAEITTEADSTSDLIYLTFAVTAAQLEQGISLLTQPLGIDDGAGNIGFATPEVELSGADVYQLAYNSYDSDPALNGYSLEPTPWITSEFVEDTEAADALAPAFFVGDYTYISVSGSQPVSEPIYPLLPPLDGSEPQAIGTKTYQDYYLVAFYAIVTPGFEQQDYDVLIAVGDPTGQRQEIWGDDWIDIYGDTQPPDDPPDDYFLRDDVAATTSGEAVVIDAFANDALPGQAALADFGDPPNGAVTYLGNGAFEYTPDPEFTGTDRFLYTVDLGNGKVDTATVTVTVAEEDCGPADPWAMTPLEGSFQQSGDGVCSVASGVTAGREDGIAAMFRVTGSSTSIGDGLITITGAVLYSEIVDISGSIFSIDSLIFDEATLTAELPDARAGDFKPAGLDILFKGMAVNPRNMAFDVEITMPDDLGGIVWTTLDFGDKMLVIDEFGAHIRQDLRINFPNMTDINLFGLAVMSFSEMSAAYTSMDDSLYLRGIVTFEDFAGGTPGSVTLDLSGEDNYLRVHDGGDGPSVSLNGTMKAEDIIEVANWKLEGLEVFFREDTREFGGKVEIETPFGVRFGTGISATVGVEFAYDPFALDAAEVEIDNLNKPIPAYPYLFLQSVGAALRNLAPGSEEATVLEGTFGITLLPQFAQDTALARGDWTVSVSSEQIVGALDLAFLTASFSYDGRDLGVLTLIEASGEATLNWADGFLSYDSFFDILGVIQGSAAIRFDRDLNFSLSSTASLFLPDWISSTFGGQSLGSSELRIVFSNDGDLSNDYVAAWQSTTLNPLGVGPELALTVGVRIGFDGTVTLINAENQPEVGSWDVAEGLDYVILTAVWENAVSDVAISVIAPDGTVIEEAGFEAAGIAVIEDLSSPTQRSVYIAMPEAGVWDIAITSPEDTGEVTGEAIGPSGDTPRVALTSTLTVAGSVVSIAYEAFDADSDATISFWYDDDPATLDGGYIGEAAELDGAAVFEWNSAGILPGTYYVYAVIDDGTTIPMTMVSENAVAVGSSSDLAIVATIPEGPLAAGQAVTISVTVTNLSSNDVTGLSSFLDLPEGAEVVASSLGGGGTELELGDLAAGAALRFEVTLTAPATATGDSRSVGVSISSDHHDADLSNNTATVRLDLPAAETTDLDGAGSSEILIGTEASERISSFDGGSDIFAGSTGADIFVFSADTDDGRRDRLMIADYEVGTDAIDLGGAPLAEVVEQGGDLLLRLGPDAEDEIVILGVQSYEQLTVI